MPPFQEFRMWVRSAPAGERALAAVAACMAAVLLVWLLVPTGDGAETDLASFGGSAPATAGSSQEGASSPGPSQLGTVLPSGPDAGASRRPGAVEPSGTGPGGETAGGEAATAGADGQGTAAPPAGGPGAAPPAAEPNCPGLDGAVRGVSSSSIKVAGVITDIAGAAANSLFGIPSADEQRQNFELIVEAINAEGGIACRAVELELFRANPGDQSGLQQRCLEIVEAGAFVVIDTGAYARFPQKQCFAQNGIPYFGGYFLSGDEQRRFYPYLFGLYLFDQLHRNTALGLRDLGFFQSSGGFERLGFIYQSCVPSMVENMTRALGEAGISGDELVTYDVGCPSTFTSPADLSQAVLTFQRSGVTHVTFASFVGDFPNFTRLAEQQGFRPRYGIPDESVISTSYGSQPPEPNNVDGAITITAGRSGEERTEGITPSEGTRRCSAIYEAAGRPPVYEQPALAGNLCSQFWMLRAAIEHAPVLRGDALADGLRRAGSVEFSYPAPPNDFTGERVTTGGQFWRPASFHLACRCWRLAAVEFRRAF